MLPLHAACADGWLDTDRWLAQLCSLLRAATPSPERHNSRIKLSLCYCELVATRCGLLCDSSSVAICTLTALRIQARRPGHTGCRQPVYFSNFVFL